MYPLDKIMDEVIRRERLWRIEARVIYLKGLKDFQIEERQTFEHLEQTLRMHPSSLFCLLCDTNQISHQ